MTGLQYGSAPCTCETHPHETKLIAVTGGPGAGKTAILELCLRSFCKHVGVLPEAASMLFGCGFPRHENTPARRAAQRAIYHVQDEMQNLVLSEGALAVGLCDRGTVDGLAYWPGTPESFYRECGTTREREFARFAAVIHLETPSADEGYNHQNPVRTETPAEAQAIDKKIIEAWEGHPNFVNIPATEDFMTKAHRAIQVIRSMLPACCQTHPIP